MYDSDLSKEIAVKINAAPKACYDNARTAFLRYKKLQHGSYVEGFSVVPLGSMHTKLHFEHAWIELADGRIVDPTWAMLCYRAEYFPGIKLGLEEFEAWRKEKKQFPFFYNFGFAGHKHPGFSEARKRAIIAEGYNGNPKLTDLYKVLSSGYDK